MNSLTPFGKTVLVTLGIIIVAIIAGMVLNGTSTQECEALYNEYSSASDMGERANIFEKGMDNGCFHYE